MFKTRKQKPQYDPGAFSTNEVVRIFGVSHRQLQWWDERGLVRPEHVGHQRRYSMKEVMSIGVVLRLRDCAMSLQKIRRVLPAILRGIEVSEANRSRFPVYAVVNGRLVHFSDEPAEVVSRLCQLKDCRLVSLLDIDTRIRKDIREEEARRRNRRVSPSSSAA